MKFEDSFKKESCIPFESSQKTIYKDILSAFSKPFLSYF